LETYGIVTNDSPEVIAYRRGMQSLQQKIMIGLGVAAVGAAVIVGGLLVKPKR
jgi:hypothetical protein